MRAYIYQARDLLSADDEGYSDPYCRVVIGNRSQKTIVQKTTVNPTWNQTLIFKNVTFYDNPEYLAEQPPPVVIEVFDWDHIVSQTRHLTTAGITFAFHMCQKCLVKETFSREKRRI